MINLGKIAWRRGLRAQEELHFHIIIAGIKFVFQISDA